MDTERNKKCEISNLKRNFKEFKTFGTSTLISTEQVNSTGNIITQIPCAVKGLKRASTPNQLAVLQLWTLDGGVGEGSTHTRESRPQGEHPRSSQGA